MASARPALKSIARCSRILPFTNPPRSKRSSARRRRPWPRNFPSMSDIDRLQQSILTDIAAANDEAALEAVRVSALGKKGSVSELLKTLGTMTPEERKEKGPRINGLKERVNDAIAARREILKNAALDARLNSETVDVTL